MRDKIYTRLEILEELKYMLEIKVGFHKLVRWSSEVLYQYREDRFEEWNEDDKEIHRKLFFWSLWCGEEEFISDDTDDVEFRDLVKKYWDINPLYPQLIKFRKDFDDWDNLYKFRQCARLVTVEEGIKAFPLFLSYVSYFNDKDYSDYVSTDLKALKPLDHEFCVKELMSNIIFLKGSYFICEWGQEIVRAILESPEHDKFLDKYLYLADRETIEEFLTIAIWEEYHKGKYAKRIGELRSRMLKLV